MLSALRHLKMREKFTLLCVYFFAGYVVFGTFLYRAVGARLRAPALRFPWRSLSAARFCSSASP